MRKPLHRTVYTVKFQGAVYGLHAFQKKSRKGITTPKADIDLINARLKRAKEFHEREGKPSMILSRPKKQRKRDDDWDVRSELA